MLQRSEWSQPDRTSEATTYIETLTSAGYIDDMTNEELSFVLDLVVETIDQQNLNKLREIYMNYVGQ